MSLDFLIASSQSVDIGTDSVLDPGSGSLAICCWIKTDIGDGVDSTLLNKGGSVGAGATRYKLNFDGNMGLVKFEIDDDSVDGKQAIETTVAGNNGKWHHMLGQRDAGANEIRIYCDGVLDGTLALPVGYGNIDSADPGTIGAAINFATGLPFEFLTGQIADARIYIGRHLSDNEIQTIYNSRGHDGIVQNLVARYLMNELPPGTAATTGVTDVGPNNLTGTPANSPTYESDELNFEDRFMRA